MKRAVIKVRKMNVGGQMRNVPHINGRPCLIRNIGNHRRIVLGSGWFDTFKSVISNPIVQDLGQFAVKKGISMLGGGAQNKRMSQDALLAEIGKSMAGTKKRN